MLIDWFTVAAQIFNFLILVALLKRFLYRPVLQAMSAREAGIAAHLEEARRQAAEAELAKQALLKKNRDLEEQRASLLEAARQEAEGERKVLLRQVRQDVHQKRQAWEEALRREQAFFLNQWGLLAGAQFVRLARQALRALSGAALEEQMVQVFLRRWQDLPEKEGRDLAAAIRRSGSRITIASSFEINVETRVLLEQAVQSRLESSGIFQYRTTPDLLCGIELTAGGLKVGWSLRDYIRDLEGDLNRELNRQQTPAPAEGGKRGATE